jgi:tetratricopeptide (TPR) repeat protein
MDIGNLLEAKGRWDEAYDVFQEALQILMKIHPHGHPEIAISLYNMAVVLQQSGRMEEALAHYREALAIGTATLPYTHPDIAKTISSIGSILDTMGDVDGAITNYSEALALRRSILAEKLKKSSNIHQTKSDSDYLAKLKSAADESLRIVVNTSGAGNSIPTVSPTANAAAVVEGMASEQQPLPHSSATATLAKQLHSSSSSASTSSSSLSVSSAGDTDLVQAISDLASAYQNRGDFQRALDLFEEALIYKRQIYEPDTEPIISSLDNIGIAYFSLGNYDLALKHHYEVLDILRRTVSPTHPFLASTLTKIGASI